MKLEMKLCLIVQSNTVITAQPGSIPVIPDHVHDGDLSTHDYKRIALNFLRSGCPTVQILFSAEDHEGLNVLSDEKMFKDEWNEFLDLVQLKNESFSFHDQKGIPWKGPGYKPPLNMSILLTRKQVGSAPQVIEL